MSNPIVRASWSLGLMRFAAAQAHPPKVLAEGQLPEVEARLAAANRFTWLPFEVYAALIEALRLELGEPGLEELMGGYVASLGTSPLYRPLLSGLDLFRNASLSIIRLYARGFSLSFKDAGAMRVAPRESGDGVHVTLSALPPACRGIAYAHGHLGSLRGAFALVGARVQATMDINRLEADGVIEFNAIELKSDG